MRVSTALRLASTALVIAGGLSLAVAGSETAASGMVMAAVAVVSLFTGSPRPRKAKFRRSLWNTLALVALFLFLGEMILTRQLLAPVVRLVVFLTIYKLFNVLVVRDYFVLYMLSLFQLLAAASISYDYRFALPFILFVVSSCYCLRLHTLVAGRESEGQAAMRASGYSGAEPMMSWRRVFGPLGVAVAILTIAVLAFPFLPRLRSDVISATLTEPMGYVSGFSTVVDLGAIGLIKTSDRIVMRVTLSGSPVALARRPKLRGIALTYFDGERWYQGSRGGELIERSQDGFFYLSEYPPGETFDQEIILKPLNTRTLFAAGRPENIRGPFRQLYFDRDGTLSLSRLYQTQIRYNVRAVLPADSPQDLRGIQANRDDGAFQRYLLLPRNEFVTGRDRLRILRLARQVTEGSADLYESMARIENYLQTEYDYTLDLRPYRTSRSKLMDFLFERREGHCEFFASAMVIMARSLGIPARLVNGFQLGHYNPIGGFFTVRAADAHSWVEVYFPGRGWIEFDPTPAGGQTNEFAGAEADIWSNLFESLDMFWIQHVLAYNSIDQELFFEDVRNGFGQVVDAFNDLVDGILALIPQFDLEADFYPPMRLFVQVLLVAASLAIIWVAILRPLLRKRKQSAETLVRKVPFYERALKLLSEHNGPLAERHPGRTARELAESLAHLSFGALFADIVEIYERVRFAADGDRPAVNAAGNARVNALERALNRISRK